MPRDSSRVRGFFFYKRSVFNWNVHKPMLFAQYPICLMRFRGLAYRYVMCFFGAVLSFSPVLSSPEESTPHHPDSVPDGDNCFIKSVNDQDYLDADEELALCRRMVAGDARAVERVVEAHLRLVVAIARGFSGYNLPLGDLIQEGSVGLMKAIHHFDPERGSRFSTVARHWIRAEIGEYAIRNYRLVRLATTKAQRKLFFNLRSLRGQGDTLSAARASDIAATLDVGVADVLEMNTRFAGRELSFDGMAHEDDDPYGPISSLYDPSADPLSILEGKDRFKAQSSTLMAGLRSLDSRSLFIIESRWLSDTPTTLATLAEKLGVSVERVRQIEAKAMGKMQAIARGEQVLAH